MQNDLDQPVNGPARDLPESTRFHFRAAQGWLELGTHMEADKELDEIPPQLRAHPDVLELRWEICCRAKKWEPCVDHAEALVKLRPEISTGWIHCHLQRGRQTETRYGGDSEPSARQG